MENTIVHKLYTISIIRAPVFSTWKNAIHNLQTCFGITELWPYKTIQM